jgi:radical SAM superfamily enzyme YgiQ (UPF0313 family)
VRVLLLSINRQTFPYPVYPLGLDHVAGALAPAHEVRILDLCPVPAGEEAAAIAAAVREHRPGAVGVSIRNVDNNDATHALGFLGEMRAAVAAVRAATDAPVVLGGAGYTLFPDELLAALGADYGVVGEGERARPLFDALEAGRSAAGLPGVAVPGRPTVRPPPLRPEERAPRALPPANPSLDHYLRRGGGVLGLQTQRGCPFRCVYCTYPGIEGSRLRRFAADAVAEEARALEAAGARFLFLTDSAFNADPRHALDVAAAFRRARLSVPWGAFFAPSRPPDGFFAAMRDAGLSHVEFGTESLSAAMLPRMGKGFAPEDVEAAHAAARAAGLHVAHFLLLGGPDESAATVEETLDRAERLEETALFFFCGMRIYPGTPLERIARAAGQLREGQSLLEPLFYEPPSLPLAAIPEKVLRRADGRPGWIVGDGADVAAKLVARLYERGMSGPLWERLVA